MRAVLLVLLAAVLFGTTGTAQALGAPDVAALSLGSARIVVGGLALALVAAVLARRGRHPGTVAPASAPPAAPAPAPAPASAPLSASAPLLAPPTARRRTALAVLVGAAGVVAYQPAFFLGTERNGVALGTLVALGSAPLATGILSWVLTRRFPGARWCVATAVAVVGLVLLAGGGRDATGGTDAVGLAASLGAGASYAVYSVMSKRLLDAGFTSASAMGSMFGAAAVVSLVILVQTDTGWLTGPAGIAAVLWLGLATVTVAYLLFAAGLEHLSAATVSTLTLAEPLTATVLGLVVLEETLTAPSWFGLGAIVAGIVILVAPRRRVVAR